MVIAEGEFEPWSTAEAADEVLVVPDHFGEPEAEDAGPLAARGAPEQDASDKCDGRWTGVIRAINRPRKRIHES